MLPESIPTAAGAMILVVDDLIDGAEVLVKLLRRTGYPADIAIGGDDLFAYLVSHDADSPALIILDVAMPHVDGIECLRRLRDDSRWRNVPVIMYTADSSHARQSQAAALGVRDYVVKGATRWPDFAAMIGRYVRP